MKSPRLFNFQWNASSYALQAHRQAVVLEGPRNTCIYSMWPRDHFTAQFVLSWRWIATITVNRKSMIMKVEIFLVRVSSNLNWWFYFISCIIVVLKGRMGAERLNEILHSIKYFLVNSLHRRCQHWTISSNISYMPCLPNHWTEKDKQTNRKPFG